MISTPARLRAVALVAAVLAVGTLSGCATEDYVDQQIATVNARIDQVNSSLSARIDQTDRTAQEALQRANEAKAAADAAAAAAQAAAVRRAGERG
jgi:outer membrane murein-binding lipoprotein Lpp